MNGGGSYVRKLRIKEHITIVGSDGQHVGTVGKVAADQIKLTKADAADGHHHFLDFGLVDRVADNWIYLEVPKGETLAVRL